MATAKKKQTTKSKQKAKVTSASKSASKSGSKYADLFDATESVEEYSKQVEEAREGSGSYIKFFSLQESETAEIRFLLTDPVRFFQHREYDRTGKKGKGSWVNLTCVKKKRTCPLCSANSQSSFKAAYLIVHLDADEGPTVKLFVRGVRDSKSIAAKSRKVDLLKESVEVERIGKATDTRYDFERTGNKKPVNFDRDLIDGARNEDQYKEFLMKRFAPRLDKMEEIAASRADSDDADSDDDYSDKKIPF